MLVPTAPKSGPVFPHVGAIRAFPAPHSGGTFGAVRKHDIHTGVDLYCPVGTGVVAVEDGIIVAVVPFTGSDTDAPSSWWHNTQAVLVESTDRVLCYGEIAPQVTIHQAVRAGDMLGTVLQVLRHDKGKPMSMLHFEMYCRGTREPVWWFRNEPQPPELLNPMPLLVTLLDGP